MAPQGTQQQTTGSVKYCAGCRKFLPTYAYATHTHDYERAMDAIIRAEMHRLARSRFARRMLGWGRNLAVCGLLLVVGLVAYQNLLLDRGGVDEVQALTEDRWSTEAMATRLFDDAGNILLPAAGQVALEAMDAVSIGDDARISALTSSRIDSTARRRLRSEMEVLRLAGGDMVFNAVVAGEQCGPARCEVELRGLLRHGTHDQTYNWAFVVVPESNRLVLAEARPR